MADMTFSISNGLVRPITAMSIALLLILLNSTGSHYLRLSKPKLQHQQELELSEAGEGRLPGLPLPAAQQILPRQYPDPECRLMYSHHGIAHFRSSAQPVCAKDDGASSSSRVAASVGGVIIHQLPWLRGKGWRIPPPPHPSTVELRGVVKQKDGSWTIPSCAPHPPPRRGGGLNTAALANVSARMDAWYDSGVPHTLAKMRLREHRPGLDLPCRNPTPQPALFIFREFGVGGNMYHELAQLFAAYMAKHIHGISDHYRGDLRVVAFDRERRKNESAVAAKFDAYFWKVFTKDRPSGLEADEELPAGVCIGRAILVHAAVRSIFWIGFVHNTACTRFTLLESFARFVLRGTLGDASVPPPRERKICYLGRNGLPRRLHGDTEFFESLASLNPHVKFETANFGRGVFTAYEAQLRWVQACTILTSTHGAALAYALFLPEEAVVVEHHTPLHGSFRGLARGVGHHLYIHVETVQENVGNWSAYARALRSAWQASGNFFHFHDTSELLIPSAYD